MDMSQRMYWYLLTSLLTIYSLQHSVDFSIDLFRNTSQIAFIQNGINSGNRVIYLERCWRCHSAHVLEARGSTHFKSCWTSVQTNSQLFFCHESVFLDIQGEVSLAK